MCCHVVKIFLAELHTRLVAADKSRSRAGLRRRGKSYKSHKTCLVCILLPVLKLAPIIFCFRPRPLGLYRHLYTPLDNHPSHGGIISTWRRPQTPWRRWGTREQLQASSRDTTRPTRARGWAPRFVSSFLSTDDKFPLSCYISALRVTRTRERR